MTNGYKPSLTEQQNNSTTWRIEVAGLSDVGRKRANNEDSFGFDLDRNIFIVCDGMGGMAAGEVASTMAVEETLGAYKKLCTVDMEPEERLDSAIASANRAVWQMAQEDHTLRGMGTTLVAACVHHDHIVVGNVGDSRAYFIRDGCCVQITEDHSYQAEQMRRGAVDSRDKLSVRLQQFITRAVGAESTVKPDFFIAELQSGDTFLLATDGLTRYVEPEEISNNFQQASNLEDTCRNLIAIANGEGAEDNVTCLLVRVI